MKYTLLFFSLSLLMVVTGCGNDTSDEPYTSPQITSPTNSDNSITPVNNLPSTIAAPIINNNIQPVSNTGSVSGNLNPEHGKPGHRCEIAVGAPLNGNATTTASTTQPTVIQQPVIKTPAATTATGLNPEHGKPGHRCDIGVGEPLNSKAAQTPTTTNPTPVLKSSIEQPIVQPFSPSPVVAEGTNPEHGKPGHRCEIAVGAPLPKQ